MSTTACWATNKLETCGWFSAGYGSTYDLTRYWISLEGLKAIVKLDWKDPINEPNKFKTATTSKLRMKYSAYHIHIPSDRGDLACEWFEEIFPLAGFYDAEYTLYQKENRCADHYSGLTSFHKTKPEWSLLQNCEMMYEVSESSHYNREFELGRNNRHYNGFFMVEDEDYNKRKKELDEKNAAMWRWFDEENGFELQEGNNENN